MKFAELIEPKLKDKFTFSLGQEIGYGAQGNVFVINDHPERVMKISFMYDIHDETIESKFESVSKIYNYIKDNNPSGLVRIYDFGHLTDGTREVYSYIKDQKKFQKIIIFYSIQEKLQQLSEDEKKVFKTICQLWRSELELKRPLEEVIAEQAVFLDFNQAKVNEFVKHITDCPVDNRDKHRRNVMKDSDGNFKMIDFDLAQLKVQSDDSD